MGLDMYLQRMPRYGNTTPNEIYAIESYFNWKNNPDARKYTMKEWCGIPFKDVPKGKTMEFYKTYCEYEYASWDTEQKYTGRYRIIEEVDVKLSKFDKALTVVVIPLFMVIVLLNVFGFLG